MTDTSGVFSLPSADERRAFRDRLGRGIAYFIPPELRQLGTFLADATPSAALERAGSASMEAVAPDRTASERLGSVGRVLSETAGVAAPLMVAPRAAVPASEALQEALLGASVGARSAGQGFVERVNRPGEVPVMYSGFDPEAIIRALREGVPAAEARLADDMRIGNERIRAESLARTGEIPSVTPPERYAEFLNQRGFSPDFQELVLGPMGDRFDTVRHIFDEDTDFALDSLRNVAGDTAGPEQLASTRSQVTRLTQELLRDFPEEITVYRAGRVVPGQPQSFTLDPNYDVSSNLPWREGSDNPLQAYTVNKANILASPDITRRGAIGEGEIIIRGEDVSTPFLYGATSPKEELAAFMRRIEERDRQILYDAAQRDIDRVGSSMNTPQDFGFFQDNPALKFSDGEEWLRGKQEAAEASYDERRGITGSITANLGSREQDMFLPTRFLRRIPGLQNERRVPGEPQYDRLMRDVQERGFLSEQDDNRIVLGINHRGEPYIQEGNTRTAVASDLGIPNVRVEVRYWNGGEMVDGPFSPENISRIAARGPENYAEGGAVMMRSDMSKELQGGIGGFADRAKNMFADGGEVGMAPPQGSVAGRAQSGPAIDVYTGAEGDRLNEIRQRIIREAGVDPVQIASEEGIDPNLMLNVIAQESGGRANARSDAGAYGYMQLMEGTARELGVDRTDPVQNLRGGARYLRQQIERFNDVPLALAAYNAGPNAVERFGGIPPYSETRTYVANILGLPGGQQAISPLRRPEPVMPVPRPAVGETAPVANPLTQLGSELMMAPAQQVAQARIDEITQNLTVPSRPTGLQGIGNLMRNMP